MADLRKFNQFMSRFLKMYLQEEFKKDEVRRWFEKSLQETAAYGEE